MCFMVCEVIFMGWLKIVIQLLDFHLVTLILHRSVFHAVTCANNTQSYTYVVFYEIVDECSKTRLEHVLTQCINIPLVFCFSCIKSMPSGVSPGKIRMPPGVVRCTSDDPFSS